MKIIKYRLPVLAVEDISRSVQFYHDLFDQEIAMDLGKNVTMSGGFCLQEDFDWLTDLPPNSIVQKSHNMELYFETDDFDLFLTKLAAFADIIYVHPPKKHDWQQRVVRIYDPDYHIIEIGESMETIALNLLEKGHSIEETAAIIQHPLEIVQQWLDQAKKTNK